MNLKAMEQKVVLHNFYDVMQKREGKKICHMLFK